jgi:hypothetical protein
MLCSGCSRPYPEEPAIGDVRRDAILHLARAVSDPKALAAARKRVGGDAARAEAVAGVIEHGVAVWSEARGRQYARKLYSILWALRCDPALLARVDPWDLAFIKEESLIQPPQQTHASGGGGGGGGNGGANAGPPSGARANAGPLLTNERRVHEVQAMVDALQEKLKARVEAVSVIAKRACPRCGSSETERIAVQTRSADEGMTQMLQCTSCGQRVRI